jgi:hypothetical protein
MNLVTGCLYGMLNCRLHHLCYYCFRLLVGAWLGYILDWLGNRTGNIGGSS